MRGEIFDLDPIDKFFKEFCSKMNEKNEIEAEAGRETKRGLF